jgi:hypothetical protein
LARSTSNCATLEVHERKERKKEKKKKKEKRKEKRKKKRKKDINLYAKIAFSAE